MQMALLSCSRAGDRRWLESIKPSPVPPKAVELEEAKFKLEKEEERAKQSKKKT